MYVFHVLIHFPLLSVVPCEKCLSNVSDFHSLSYQVPWVEYKSFNHVYLSACLCLSALSTLMRMTVPYSSSFWSLFHPIFPQSRSSYGRTHRNAGGWGSPWKGATKKGALIPLCTLCYKHRHDKRRKKRSDPPSWLILLCYKFFIWSCQSVAISSN